MGLLDSILGSVLGNAMGQSAPRQAQAGSGGSGVLVALLPIVLGMLMNRQGRTAAGSGSGGGGLGDVLGGVLGGRAAPTGGGGGLGDILGGLLGGGAGATAGTGGLGGLLEQFQRAGFADQANSWVSTGQNLPISPDAISQVFGNDTLAQIARQAGISDVEASEGLSQLLPEVVDRVTPNGTVPDLDQLAASVDSLLRQRGVG
jgi:uncharacterized protein YidB (DUF937 family)